MLKAAEKIEASEKDKKNDGKNKKAPKPIDTTKYEGVGQCFKAKLIGFEDVADAKGEKMCQVAIAKVKAGVLALGEHKEKIVLNLNLDGISIYDEKKEVLLYRHDLRIISYVARDGGDYRTFAYIINDENGKHRCVAIKTEKSADVPVACLKELFYLLEEKSSKAEEEEVSVTNGTIAPAVEEVSQNTGGEVAIETSQSTEVAIVSNNGDPNNDKGNLFGLENDFLGFALSPPAPVQSQKVTDLSVLLLDDVFGVTTSPVPHGTTPASNTGVNLFSSPLDSPAKPPGVPQYQQFLSRQLSSSMENSFSPLQNAILPPPPGVHQMNHPSPFRAVVQAQNGWTSFDVLQAVIPVPNSSFSSDFISPVGSLQQQQPPIQFSQQTETPQSTNSVDPFSDLSFLSNIPNQAARKPISREDFVKDPPKITLMDLVGQKKDAFGYPTNTSQQYLATNSVSFDDSISYNETSEDILRQRRGTFLKQNSVQSEPCPQTPVPLVRMSHLDKLRNSTRPISIDFSIQRFSAFEDKRGLAEPTEVNWFCTNAETPKPNPTPRARQRFMNN